MTSDKQLSELVYAQRRRKIRRIYRMKEALQSCKKYGSLVRHSGGFWSSEDVQYKDVNLQNPVPVWYFGTRTIRALIKRNLVTPVKFMKRGDPWKVVPTESEVE